MEQTINFLTGIGGATAVWTAVRASTGAFFAISGYHKLFNRARHMTLVQTLEADGIPYPKFNQWFVPGVEFLAGLALIVGFLTPLAATGLFVICAVATCVDGLGRIKSWEPVDKADWLDDILYLPEMVYLAVLALFIASGAGAWSLDALIVRVLSTGG